MLETDTENGVPVLRFSGRLDAAAAASTWQAAHRAARGRFVVDARRVEAMDSAGAALLAGLGEGAEWREPEAEAPRLVLHRFRAGLERVVPPAAPKPLPWLAQIGAPFVARAGGLRERLRFLGETVLAGSATALRPWRLRWREVVRHLDEAGTRAFPLCVLLGVLIGVILAFQSSIPMRQFGAEIFIPQLVGISLARELGPLLASIVLAGRTASAYAAELGTMKVNEEVDAIRTMGLEPVAWLVLPRVAAAMMVMPVLALVMTITGIVGMGIVMATLGYPPVAVANQLRQWLSLGDVTGGLAKAAVFGLAIGYIGCRSGLSAGRGPRAVGDAATMAVVGGIVSLVVLDGLFAVLFFRLGW